MRLHVIAVFGLLALILMIIGQTAVARPAAQDYPSGGLGLSQADWEDLYGPSEIGQSYVIFGLADGAYHVGFAGDEEAANFIERSWEDETGVPLDEAQEEAETLLPEDARFVETYNAASARILFGSRIDRYQSRTLAAQLAGGPVRYGGNFVVVYDLIPATDSFDQLVVRFVVTAAERD